MPQVLEKLTIAKMPLDIRVLTDDNGLQNMGKRL